MKQKLIKSDFSGPIGVFPLFCIEYDASSTQIKGISSVSLNAHYLDDETSEARKINLAVKTFDLAALSLEDKPKLMRRVLIIITSSLALLRMLLYGQLIH